MTLLLLAALTLPCAGRARSDEPNVAADHAAAMTKGLAIFKEHVRPVLAQKCLRCHGGKETEGNLDLTERAGLLRGGTSGPAIVAGNARGSLLYQLVTHAREPHMPKSGGKLPAETAARLAAWIDAGAPYDEPLAVGKKAPAWTEKKVPDAARQFWSFQPLHHAAPPAVRDAAWCRTPVDRFVLAKLEAAGVAPNPAVNRRQLIRRAYFDLTGLPPPADAVEAFVQDTAPDAYNRLLDRLLASPRHGERWARYWLDVARFAESHGFEHDYDRPTAYHYRDFVIRALNADMPFDTFVKWQLAGDELAPDDNLALTATGFLAAGVHSTQITKNEVEKHRYDELDDMLATTSTAMLGLTVGCARCHDHKFDPIPQADYYRLLATFTTTVRSEIDLNLDPEGHKKATAAFDREHAPLAAALAQYESGPLPARRAALHKAWEGRADRHQGVLLDAISRRGLRWAGLAQWTGTADPEWRRLKQAVLDHQKKAPNPKTVKALIATEGLQAVRLHTQGEDFLKETHFLRRGDPNQKEGVAAQGFLQALTPGDAGRWRVPPPAGSRLSYRRTALANWLTDVDQGGGRLLARVIVNRLWQHHLGRGLVATPSDFGNRGEPPSHPELLDWLAGELIRQGWRLKPIHKLILSSATYQQGPQLDEMKLARDRDNRLFWRRPRQRLEAEVIRDALLAVAGALDPTMYGPGTLNEESKRRSIYFTVKRSRLLPMMQVFDAPEALVSIGDRPTTTIAPQALMLMNNPQVREHARSFAQRIAPDARTPADASVKTGYLAAFARPPSAEELADATAFLQAQAESYRLAGRADGRALALADFCQALMCLNEFVYLD